MKNGREKEGSQQKRKEIFSPLNCLGRDVDPGLNTGG
jgi:hypothetical protein